MVVSVKSLCGSYSSTQSSEPGPSLSEEQDSDRHEESPCRVRGSVQAGMLQVRGRG